MNSNAQAQLEYYTSQLSYFKKMLKFFRKAQEASGVKLNSKESLGSIGGVIEQLSFDAQKLEHLLDSKKSQCTLQEALENSKKSFESNCKFQSESEELLQLGKERLNMTKEDQTLYSEKLNQVNLSITQQTQELKKALFKFKVSRQAKKHTENLEMQTQETISKLKLSSKNTMQKLKPLYELWKALASQINQTKAEISKINCETSEKKVNLKSYEEELFTINIRIQEKQQTQQKLATAKNKLELSYENHMRKASEYPILLETTETQITHLKNLHSELLLKLNTQNADLNQLKEDISQVFSENTSFKKTQCQLFRLQKIWDTLKLAVSVQKLRNQHLENINQEVQDYSSLLEAQNSKELEDLEKTLSSNKKPSKPKKPRKKKQSKKSEQVQRRRTNRESSLAETFFNITSVRDLPRDPSLSDAFFH